MKSLKKIFCSEKGSMMINALLAIGMMSASMMIIMGMNQDVQKSSNDTEFKLKRQLIKDTLISQVFNNSANCKCIFEGLIDDFNRNPSSPMTLTGSTPSDIGKFQFTTPGSCSGASVPYPIVSSNKIIDGVKIQSARFMDITRDDNNYVGNLAITLSNEEIHLGSNTGAFKIPVTVKTTASANPSLVKFDGCLNRGTGTSNSNSVVKFGPEDGVGQSMIPSNGSQPFRFNQIPSSATGVFIQYTIGSPANGRADRYCTISGGGVSVQLGNDSKGDGGQRMVAGTAFVPLDGCTGNLTINCSNKNSRGSIKVLATIDSGAPPVCANSNPCGAHEIFDGVECVAMLDDDPDCAEGMIDTDYGCIPLPQTGACKANEIFYNGNCYSVTAQATGGSTTAGAVGGSTTGATTGGTTGNGTSKTTGKTFGGIKGGIRRALTN